MGITACLRNLEQKVLISEAQNLCNELGLFDFDENPGTQKGSDFRDDCTELILHVSLYS